MKHKLNFKITKREHDILVDLSGDVADGAEESLKELHASLGGRPVVFDAAGIRRLNSFGVAQWIRFLGSLRGVPHYEFHNCSVPVIYYLNLLPHLLGAGRLVSFHATFQCSGCEARRDLPHQVGPDLLAQLSAEAPCPDCGRPMRLADSLELFEGLVGAA